MTARTAAEAGPTEGVSARRIAVAVLAVVATTLAARIVVRDAPSIGMLLGAVRPGRLVASTVLEIALLAWGVFLWSKVLGQFDAPEIGYRNLLTVWWRSSLAKYLPGAVWSVAATAEAAPQVGGSAVALPSSFVLQGAFTVTAALCVALLFGGSRVLGAAGVPTSLAFTILGVAVVLAHPVVVNAVVGAAARLARRDAPHWRASWISGGLLLAAFVGTWVAYGLVFGMFFTAIFPTVAVDWAELVAINAIAFAGGFLAFFAPGGLGVRETILVGLLAPVLPALGPRIAAAAMSRVWLLSTEAMAGTVVALTGRRWRRRGGRRQHQVPLARVAAPPLCGVVTPMPDSRAALHEIAASLAAAQGSIRIVQLAFDPDCTPVGGDGTTILDTLVATAGRSDDPVDVRILLNGGLLLDTSHALRAALAACRGGERIAVRRVRAFPRVMHSKAIIVDDTEAFLMGASLVNGYWDGAAHYPAGHPAPSPGAGARPLHDVAVRVRGDAVREIARRFDALWTATPADPGSESRSVAPRPPAANRPANSASAHAVRVLQTLPASAGTATPATTQVLEEYLTAIAGARAFVYLESQYFSSRRIADAVARALAASPRLEVILIINQNPDVSGYRGWQNARLAEAGLLDHPRVGVFALWSARPSHRTAGRVELTQQFVHSKVAVIDDSWMTIGSANLDGASLHSYGDDFERAPLRALFGGICNFDLNVACGQPGGQGDCADMIRDFRAALWRRHLGAVAVDAPAGAGWLDAWRDTARANVGRLREGDWARLSGTVFPYVPQGRPRAQLAAMGLDLAQLPYDLRFDPGPVEVLWSPGWMKRIIPNLVRQWR